MSTITLTQKIFAPIYFLAFMVLSLYVSSLAKKGKVPHIRTLPAISGIDESIAICAQQGKPAYYEITGSLSGVSGDSTMVVAGVEILPYVARCCAKNGVRLISGYGYPEVLPLMRRSLQEAYKAEGKPEMFREEDLRYLSPDAFSSAAQGMSIVEHEDCRAAIAMGNVSINTLPLAEANKANNCICIQGSAYMSSIHAVGLVTDYNLIGEELYGAGASLSGDVDTMSSLRGQDIAKAASVAFMAVLLALKALGIKP